MSWTAITQAPTDQEAGVLVVEYPDGGGEGVDETFHPAGGDPTAWDVEAASQLLLGHGWRLLGPWEPQNPAWDAPRMHHAEVEPAPTGEARVPYLD